MVRASLLRACLGLLSLAFTSCEEERESPEAAEIPARSAQLEAAASRTPPGDRTRGESVAPGIGSVTGRVPDTEQVVTGVRVVSHVVRATIRDGFARTEVEEVLRNDTGRVLEGRYVFPLPPDASVARVALWVGEELVEGEVVEKVRAGRIFKDIVDGTARDPALLERLGGSRFSMKIFPIPARGERKVLIAYDQALPTAQGRLRYVVPLGLGVDRRAPIDRVAIEVDASDARGPLADPRVSAEHAVLRTDGARASASFEATGADVPADFAFSVADPRGTAAEPRAEITFGPSRPQGARWFVLRATLDPGPATFAPSRLAHDRAVVLDVGHAQSPESLALQADLAREIIGQLDPEERFVLLRCAVSCETFPPGGLAPASDVELAEASRWLGTLDRHGSSDRAGALLAAARHLDPGQGGQVVVLGDGTPTSGELSAEDIAARAGPELSARGVDLRLVGVGAMIDDDTLRALAASLGGTYERLRADDDAGEHIVALADGLRAPVVRVDDLSLPDGLIDVVPGALPAQRIGQELTIYGRVSGEPAGAIGIRGRLAGEEVAWSLPLRVFAAEPSPVTARLWAGAKLADLERSSDPDSIARAVAVSRQHRVLSRHTAWLVLENDRMFAQFGVPRTRHGEDPWVPTGPPLLDHVASLGVSSAARDALGASAGSRQVLGPVGNASVGGASVSGGAITNAAAVVARMAAGYRRCYARGLAKNPATKGSLRITARIGPHGEVLSVEASGGAGLDPSVVACIRARVASAQFAPPEGGGATIVIPVSLFPEPGARVASFSPHGGRPAQPTVQLRPGDDAWMHREDPQLASLRRDREVAADSRVARAALVRGLLRNGRFDEAHAEATGLVALDPDLDAGYELLAATSAATGRDDRAARALDLLAALAPWDAARHQRAARAFEAMGNQPAATAHQVSLAAVARATAQSLPLGADRELLPQATVTWRCQDDDARCPSVFLLGPDGSVTSAVTPAGSPSSARSFSLSWLGQGVHRVMLAGGAPDAHGHVVVRALGTARERTFAGVGPRTLIEATVTLR